MTSSTPQTVNLAENWEAKLEQLRKEPEHQKLSPEEQAKKEAQLKRDYEQEKAKLKAELYGGATSPGQPGQKTGPGKFPNTAEADEKASELAEADRLLGDTTSSDKKPDNFENPEKMKKFMGLFDDCSKSISQKEQFKFPTFAINQLGIQVEQSCQLSKIIDHSSTQQDLRLDQISSRLSKKEAKPQNIGLVIDVSKITPENPSLMNLTMEIPLADLMSGNPASFSQLISAKAKNYTETVQFALISYDRAKKEAAAKPVSAPKDTTTKPQQIGEIPLPPEAKQVGINEIHQGGSVLNSNGNLEQGDTSTVNFRCNNGNIWGTFDIHRTTSNPKEMAEILERRSTEK